LTLSLPGPPIRVLALLLPVMLSLPPPPQYVLPVVPAGALGRDHIVSALGGDDVRARRELLSDDVGSIGADDRRRLPEALRQTPGITLGHERERHDHSRRCCSRHCRTDEASTTLENTCLLRHRTPQSAPR